MRTSTNITLLLILVFTMTVHVACSDDTSGASRPGATRVDDASDGDTSNTAPDAGEMEDAPPLDTGGPEGDVARPDDAANTGEAPDATMPDTAAPDTTTPDAPLEVGEADVAADVLADEIPFQTGVTVVTTEGEAMGEADGELRVFKGIPFAEPPVGDRRFKAPVPAEPRDGVLRADAFGPSCLQSISLNSNGASEDCLTLNVWAHMDDEPRPVMVWIYGGGFVIGETALGTYDGANLAESADVVVISINYRLGVLGNLALPELRDEDALGAVGNMGLLDQIEALRWVKANAAAFGGDPDNVTVFGESAGAISTCALMGSPLADDLFEKAILQSGNCNLFTNADGDASIPGSPTALESGERVTETLGCDDAEDRLACLRGLPAQDLVDAVPFTSLLNLFESEAALGWTIDGVVLPKTPYARIIAGEAPARPVIAGSNGNEAFIFTSNQTILTRGGFRDTIAPLVGGEAVAQQVVDLYSLLRFPLAKDAFNAFVGEWLFNCNTYHTVRALDGAGYYYALGIAPALLTTTYGPMHGADIFYVFGNFVSSGIIPTLIDLDVSSKVQLAWGAFARTGVPVWEGGWPPARQVDPEHLGIDLLPGVEDEFRAGRCDALQALGVLP